MSIAMRHRQAVLAKRAQAEAKEKAKIAEKDYFAQASEADQNFQLLLVQLKNDCKRVKESSKGRHRDELKHELITTYLPVIDKYFAELEEGGDNYRNPLIAQVIIWMLDVGLVSDALLLTEKALEDGQKMPENFKRRDIESFVCDEVHDWAKGKNLSAEDQKHFDAILDKITSEEWIVNDDILAKFYKLKAEQTSEDEQALHFYRLAYELGAPCKTAIAKLEKKLAKL